RQSPPAVTLPVEAFTWTVPPLLTMPISPAPVLVGLCPRLQLAGTLQLSVAAVQVFALIGVAPLTAPAPAKTDPPAAANATTARRRFCLFMSLFMNAPPQA